MIMGLFSNSETSKLLIIDYDLKFAGLDIRDTSEKFEIELPAGTYNSRFSLRFLNPSALGTNQNELQNGIVATRY